MFQFLHSVFSLFYNSNIYEISRFPLNTLLTQKVLTVIEQDYNEQLLELSRTFSKFYWQNDKLINLPDVIKEALVANGFDSESIEMIFERAQSSQIAELLKKRTEEAVANGVFGVPSFLVKRDRHSDKELFFGCDRVDLMMRWIGFEPVPFYKSKL